LNPCTSRYITLGLVGFFVFLCWLGILFCLLDWMPLYSCVGGWLCGCWWVFGCYGWVVLRGGNLRVASFVGCLLCALLCGVAGVGCSLPLVFIFVVLFYGVVGRS